ncbi:hypothetical protein ACS0TY_024433 [Phlomoides rotata]
MINFIWTGSMGRKGFYMVKEEDKHCLIEDEGQDEEDPNNEKEEEKSPLIEVSNVDKQNQEEANDELKSEMSISKPLNSSIFHHTENMSHFHSFLQSVLKLHSLFLVQHEPVHDDSEDPRWQNFKGYLGALDETCIDVHIPTVDQMSTSDKLPEQIIGMQTVKTNHVNVNSDVE